VGKKYAPWLSCAPLKRGPRSRDSAAGSIRVAAHIDSSVTTARHFVKTDCILRKTHQEWTGHPFPHPSLEAPESPAVFIF